MVLVPLLLSALGAVSLFWSAYALWRGPLFIYLSNQPDDRFVNAYTLRMSRAGYRLFRMTPLAFLVAGPFCIWSAFYVLLWPLDHVGHVTDSGWESWRSAGAGLMAGYGLALPDWMFRNAERRTWAEHPDANIVDLVDAFLALRD